jgi:hypothetical protein
VHIDWNAFGEVLLVSFGTAVGVMVLFAFGTAMLAGPGGGAGGPRDGAGVGAGARAIAGLCYLACAAVVAYGLYVIAS